MNELLTTILRCKAERIYVVGSSWVWMGRICRELALQQISLLTRMNSFEATVPAGVVTVYFIKESDARRLNTDGAFLKFNTGEWNYEN